MPFGKKPLPDGRTYDFEKIYRVIIKRAVEEAGMRSLRADETVGSGLIHSDMFKDLRDRPVVLADLSLENPNVFYELGIRHVMSPSGTVLICRKGTTLPFDVGLSRVIFYEFDGEALDWEEVEKTVTALKLALQEAANDQLDSPVHALLQHVSRSSSSVACRRDTATHLHGGSLVKYQKGLARSWLDSHVEIETLFNEHMGDDFGLRALGYYCFQISDVTGAGPKVAENLAKAAQYDVATELYAKLYAAGRLAGDDLLKFAAAYADGCPDFEHINTAIRYVDEVLAEPDQKLEVVALAHARLGSLLQKKWELTEERADLEEAIAAYLKARDHMQDARNRGAFRFPGMIAHTRLKLLTLRRKGSSESRRQDTEQHRDAILRIIERPEDDPASISYLHWAQAIALADLGRTDEASKRAVEQLAEDAKLAAKCVEVGGRQYLTIRRFLERYHDTLANMEVISRQLCVNLRKLR